VRGARHVAHHPARLHRGARRVVRPEAVLDQQPRAVVGHGAGQSQRLPGGRQLQAIRRLASGLAHVDDEVSVGPERQIVVQLDDVVL